MILIQVQTNFLQKNQNYWLDFFHQILWAVSTDDVSKRIVAFKN